MDNKNVQFLEKLDKLPEEVGLYFSSKVSGDAIYSISKDYSVDFDYVYDLLLDFVISDFDIENLKKNISVEMKNEENQNKFIADFLGRIFLAVDDFIVLSVEKELKKRNASLDGYVEYVKRFEELVDDKNSDNFYEVLSSLDDDFDEKEEERLSLNFLEKNLVEILKFSDPAGARKINGSIIYLLNNKQDAQTKFSRAFLSNQEKLTKEYLIVEGRKQDPTVSNWIKDFVKENGSDMFNNIALAKYISSSVNCVRLDSDEKRLVKKVLRLYRNLNFFPESMKDVPFVEWEIIPVDKDDVVREQKKEEIISSPEEAEEEKEIEKVRKTLEDKSLEELNDLLKNNPDKNLKRKAIESEIKKIKKNN